MTNSLPGNVHSEKSADILVGSLKVYYVTSPERSVLLGKSSKIVPARSVAQSAGISRDISTTYTGRVTYKILNSELHRISNLFFEYNKLLELNLLRFLVLLS